MSTSEITKPCRAVVVDRWPLVRNAIEELLITQSIEIAGTAGTFENAFQLCRSVNPDIVITDCTLLGSADGLALGRRLRALKERPYVLMYSSSNAPEVVAACISGAADGFLHRSAEPETLILAVETLIVGKPVWSLSAGEAIPVQRSLHHDSQLSLLTSREKEVLRLLLQRYTNDEIAQELVLAKQTVKNYVSTILQKLEISSRRELHGRLVVSAP
jgi:DNA-binding NarL/FixJ family response regulator